MTTLERGLDDAGALDCATVRERVLDLALAGERGLAPLGEHLARCEACRQAATDGEVALDALALDPAPAPPADLEVRVLGAVARQRRWGGLTRAAAFVAMGALAGALGASRALEREPRPAGVASTAPGARTDLAAEAPAAPAGRISVAPAEEASAALPGAPEAATEPSSEAPVALAATPREEARSGPAPAAPSPLEDLPSAELRVGEREIRDLDLGRLAEVARLALLGFVALDGEASAAIRDEAVRLASLYASPEEQAVRRLLLETATAFAAGARGEVAAALPPASARALSEALGRVRVTLVIPESAAAALGAAGATDPEPL